MCLRLFRNFVSSRLPHKRRKGEPKPSVSKRLDPEALPQGSVGHKPLSTDCNGPEHVQEGPISDKAVHWRILTEEESRKLLLEAFADLEVPENNDANSTENDQPIDPTKAYFTALPLDIKLEILDRIEGGYKMPLGGQAYSPERFRIQPSDTSSRHTLRALRLCDRDLRELCLHRLFAFLNFNARGRLSPKHRPYFEQNLLPTVASYARYISVYLEEAEDSTLARILDQLPHVKWVLLIVGTSSPNQATVEALLKYKEVIRLSAVLSFEPDSTSNIAGRLLTAYGHKLRQLELFHGWGHTSQELLLSSMRTSVTHLERVYVYGPAESIVSLLYKEPTWESRNTLTHFHAEASMELDAWVVASIVENCPVLKEVNICSCGGPGTYNDAAHRQEERYQVVQRSKPLRRAPLDSLRIVHATDVEFRHMCSIPTKRLVIYDPLDQLVLGELLSNKSYYPSLTEVELQYVMEPRDNPEEAFQSIKDATEKRGGCEFIDSRNVDTYSANAYSAPF